MKIGICSGYFNPLHVGHLKMFTAAKYWCDKLVVIVNNDEQQMLKKGRIIMTEGDRLEILRQLKPIDEVVLSIDDTPSVCKTLLYVRQTYYYDDMFFCNGGDRNSDKECPEVAVCKNNRIHLMYGVGGDYKYDSSSRIHGG